MNSTESKPQFLRAIIVSAELKSKSGFKNFSAMNDYMIELEELCQADMLEVVGSIVQMKDSFEPKYLVGKGKLSEIKELAEKLSCDIIVFSHELSGSQLRNLTDALSVKVIDRTNLILDIFSKRAISGEGKLQVELAMQNYRYTRLKGLGEELSGQTGGIGTKGPGEKKLETDKRHIRTRIYAIEKELENYKNNRKVMRKRRLKNKTPIVALIGYTNSGKSTLFNQIIKTHPEYSFDKEVLTKDMLFASLEVRLRKALLPNSGMEYLIIDTVGFISDIPHYLIEAFKATLEEIKYADLLLNVVDISNQNHVLQEKTALDVIKDLNIEYKPVITVYNKIDKLEATEDIQISRQDSVYISALKEYNLNELYEKIEACFSKFSTEVKLLVPYEDTSLISRLKDDYNFEENYTSDGIIIKLSIRNRDLYLVKKYLI